MVKKKLKNGIYKFFLKSSVPKTIRKEIPKDFGKKTSTETHFMPCWKTEFLLVLQTMRSAHWTTTMLAKKAVWQVNSTIFLCSYVWRGGEGRSA